MIQKIKTQLGTTARLKSALALCSLLWATEVHASVIYDYVGNQFTNTNGGVLTTSMRVSGYIELTEPLVSGYVDPFGFNFEVGPLRALRLPDQPNVQGPTSTLFRFLVSGTGHIEHWQVALGLGGGEINSYNWDIVFDQASAATGIRERSGSAFVNNSPGHWTIRRVATSVPEPSTIALIGMALLSLFGFGLMRRRELTSAC